jgi:hypothetical protein
MTDEIKAMLEKKHKCKVWTDKDGGYCPPAHFRTDVCHSQTRMNVTVNRPGNRLYCRYD